MFEKKPSKFDKVDKQKVLYNHLYPLSDTEMVWAFYALKKIIAESEKIKLEVWYRKNIVPRIKNPSP